ncbi:hypothetical protein [Kitasatospora cheerisanensis]|uniref:Uncharacterized protein n=1 Tax=Kitasatospora cheerisanensis KCTC 2395 TaxID=1348663 RepID=A0A066Z3D2_9ACTN|nr:hypothetical protein [Kitasatospora cheerisanensis]KDN86729.1 hypothetical protein KCH_15170 [Kitasatospora cheerisanensis KCTC 2395]
MSERLRTRRMLLMRGWTEDSYGILRRSDAPGVLWAPAGSGDSGIDGPSYSISLNGDVPDRIIVALATLIADDIAKTHR